MYIIIIFSLLAHYVFVLSGIPSYNYTVCNLLLAASRVTQSQIIGQLQYRMTPRAYREQLPQW